MNNMIYVKILLKFGAAFIAVYLLTGLALRVLGVA